jgi:ABC-type transporter Mla MlaB component
VVFSFFKKDPKDAKKGAGGRGKPAAPPRTGGGAEVATRPMVKPIGRPLPGPTNRSLDRSSLPTTGIQTTETALPDREQQRNNARKTAEKIDAIEAEMARDLLHGIGRNSGSTGQTTVPTVAAAAAPAAATVVRSGNTLPPMGRATTIIAPPLDVNSDMLGGDIDAIEINTSGGSSVIDETAILFSNGQLDAAEAVLRAGLRRDDLGSSARAAWLMLFELVNQRGDRAAFEQLTMDYALRFENTPPAWFDYAEAAPAGRATVGAAMPATPPPSGAPSVRLPPAIDAGIVGHLEQLRSLTAAHAAVQLDASDARSVDIAGASLLLRVLTAFKRSHRELTLVGAAGFAEVLIRSVESGRRDPDDALWMLLLELLRMLNRQEEFEEAAIQYCITFEVSPPSWESPVANLKIAAASNAPAVAADGAAAAAPLELRGVVEGDGEPHFGRLLVAAKGQEKVTIDCLHLRRLAFSAGSALLGSLQRIRKGGATIELRNANALVAALLHLLGIGSTATVHPRHA